MKPYFLTGKHIYLRAMKIEDKEHATAWFNSQLPINAVRAEKFLRDELKKTWGPGRRYYVICRNDDDVIVGGIKAKTHEGRVMDTDIRMAPHLSDDDADFYKAQALEQLVPWMSEENEYMAVNVECRADEPQSIAMAEKLGMELGVQVRGYFARPGHRVDLLIYQALNTNWKVRNA